MGSLVFLLIAILGIVAIVDAVKSSLSVEKKMLWILLILFMPVLGLLLYYLLGKVEE